MDFFAKYEFIHQNKNIMEKFTKETYERFIKMVENGQIIVVAHRLNKRSFTQEYKIIGANSEGRWDFTPMVAYLTDCKTNGGGVTNLACRGQYSDSLVYSAFCCALRETNSTSKMLFEDVARSYAFFQM